MLLKFCFCRTRCPECQEARVFEPYSKHPQPFNPAKADSSTLIIVAYQPVPRLVVRSARDRTGFESADTHEWSFTCQNAWVRRANSDTATTRDCKDPCNPSMRCRATAAIAENTIPPGLVPDSLEILVHPARFRRRMRWQFRATRQRDPSCIAAPEP